MHCAPELLPLVRGVPKRSDDLWWVRLRFSRIRAGGQNAMSIDCGPEHLFESHSPSLISGLQVTVAKNKEYMYRPIRIVVKRIERPSNLLILAQSSAGRV